ncbi:MAG TPA: PIN domain-containing protein [Bryobacteraceae bacterium]|jgi:predicted nucleic acid-binding protein|nr:PIN domain-containing protein [Bryobacteraceae bacterium]
MSGDSIFVDTNVLLYSFDPRNPLKYAQTRNWLDYLWRTGAGRLSWQVLHEFYTNAVRKLGVPALEAREAVTVFSKWRPGGMNISVIERGWYWMDQAQLSYWDSLILASAERLGCSILLSEDFQTGRSFEGVRVVSPFENPPE